MSKEAFELYQKLQNINNKGIRRVEMAVVQSVDTNANTCKVLLDDLPINNVRLKATVNNNSGFIIYPALNSDVLIEQINDGSFIVRMVSEVDSVAVAIGNKKYTLDKDGHYIGDADNTLLSVLNLIIDATMETIVFQGRNPNYEKLQQAKLIAQQFLK